MDEDILADREKMSGLIGDASFKDSISGLFGDKGPYRSKLARDRLDESGVWAPDSLALDTFSAMTEMESFFFSDKKLVDIILSLKAFVVGALPPLIRGRDLAAMFCCAKITSFGYAPRLLSSLFELKLRAP